MKSSRRVTTIVPGRRMITTAAALYAVGLPDDQSYLAEKTLISADSTMNATTDAEERGWRKQGISETEIFRRQEERTLKKHSEAVAHLRKKMFGAKNFAELLARPEYSIRENEEEADVEEDADVQRNENIFAMPALPKHLSEKSIFGSPSGMAKGSGKPGLSCSTPVGGKDVSMRSLRTLDISHVANATQSDSTKVIVQQKTVALHFDDTTARNSSLQGTYTVGKEGEAESLQKTFTVSQQESTSLQGTFVKETEKITDQPEVSLESTSVQQANSASQTTEIQQTFANCVLQEPVLEKNLLQGGEKRKGKKMDLKEREGRMADLTSSLLNSMMASTPSPGAHHFKNPRKKIRESLPTPPRMKGIDNRMSIESDKERSIEMLSMAESTGRDSVGSSYIDPISVNASRVSPIREVDESHQMETMTTPKSSRRNEGNNIRQLKSIEQIREVHPSSRISSVAVEASESLTTPTHGYQKPTFSSIVKNKNSKESTQLLEEMNKKRTPSRTPVGSLTKTPLRQLISKSDEKMEDSQTPEEHKEEAENQSPVETEAPKETEKEDVTNKSMGNVAVEMNALSMNDRQQPDDFDHGDDHYGEEVLEDSYREEGIERAPEQPEKPIKRGIALLSDSIATVNTPGLDRRGIRINETVADEWDSDDEEGSRRNRRKNGKHVGLQLAKRKIIEPVEAQDGVRRSSRVRVKPVRSWLGEQPVYVHSPSGGRRLKGVTDVIIKDKRLCKYRTADWRLATEREQREKAKKRERAAEKRRRLALDQSRGHRLNESQEDILTSDED